MTGNRIWMLGVSLAAVVVVAFGWLFAIAPVLAQADLASSQVQSTDAQNAAQRVALVKLKSQYDKLPDLTKQLKKLQVAMPESSGLDDLLDQLQALAQANDVTITAFTAAEATQYGGDAATAQASPTPTPTATPAPSDGASPQASGTAAVTPSGNSVTGQLFSVPVTVAVKGTPEQIMAFTDAAQKGARFFLVVTDTFTGSTDSTDGTGSGAAAGTTSGTGTLTGFVFVVRGAATSAATSK